MLQGVQRALDVVIGLVAYKAFILERGGEVLVVSAKHSPWFSVLHFCVDSAVT